MGGSEHHCRAIGDVSLFQIGMGDSFVHPTWALPMDIQSGGHQHGHITSLALPATHFHLQLALGSKHQRCSFFSLSHMQMWVHTPQGAKASAQCVAQ